MGTGGGGVAKQTPTLAPCERPAMPSGQLPIVPGDALQQVCNAVLIHVYLKTDGHIFVGSYEGPTGMDR